MEIIIVIWQDPTGSMVTNSFTPCLIGLEWGQNNNNYGEDCEWLYNSHLFDRKTYSQFPQSSPSFGN